VNALKNARPPLAVIAQKFDDLIRDGRKGRQKYFYERCNRSGSLATLAAMRRASSRVSDFGLPRDFSLPVVSR